MDPHAVGAWRSERVHKIWERATEHLALASGLRMPIERGAKPGRVGLVSACRMRIETAPE